MEQNKTCCEKCFDILTELEELIYRILDPRDIRGQVKDLIKKKKEINYEK